MKSTTVQLSFAIGLLTAAAALGAAPAGQYSINATTVVDLKTTLTWQRASSPSTMSQAAAVTYCLNLSLAGASDWRLPTIKELQSLIDVRVRNPAVDTVAFPSTPSLNFWSSTPKLSFPGNVWAVRFSDGLSYNLADTSLVHVRCVR